MFIFCYGNCFDFKKYDDESKEKLHWSIVKGISKILN